MSKETVYPKEVGPILTATWEYFKNNIGFIALLSVVNAIAAVPMSIAAVSLNSNISQSVDSDPFIFESVEFSSVLLFIFGFIVILVVGFVLNTAATVAFMRTIKTKESVTLGEAIVQAKPYYARVIGISLLVGLIIMGGFILLIIPGILFALWYMFAVPTAIEHKDLSIGKVLNRSKQLFRTRWQLPIVWILLSIALSIGASIVLLPAMFLLGALSGVAADTLNNVVSAALSFFFLIGFVYVYYALQQETDESAPSVEAPSTPDQLSS